MVRALVLVLALCLVSPGVSTAQSGQFGPLKLQTLDGKTVSLEDLEGKVVLLNFWATWCQPCVAEFPLLVDLAGRYGSRGFVVVAASIDEADNRFALGRYADKIPAAMQIWIGATTDDMQRLGLGASIPVSVLLGPDGTVKKMQRGPLAAGGFDAAIKMLLEDAPRKKVPGIEQAKNGDRSYFSIRPVPVSSRFIEK